MQKCVTGMFAFSAVLITTTVVYADDRPNIVFILVDDMAWSDLHCYGNSIHDTPHIDKLAAEGIRFTQAYAPAPICSASRASILTGKFPGRLHFEFVTKSEPGQQKMDVPLQSPPFTLNLPLPEKTIAELLGETDYSTGFFGKWHVNQHHHGYLGWSPTHGPLQQGFAEGTGDFGCHPYSYRNRPKTRDQTLEKGTYPRDTLTEKAVEYIRSHRDDQFFLYLSHYFVHDPVHSRCEWLIEKYEKSLHAQSKVRQTSKLIRKRAEYAAMVETLDQMVGQVMNELDNQKLSEKTLIVLMSDNGGHPNYTTNAPLRGSKWNLYEGGIRVPMIMRWPNQIEGATQCNHVVHGCDLLPTFCDVAGVSKMPDAIDGVSLLSVLRDPKAIIRRERPLIWHFPYYHPEKGFSKSPGTIGVGDFQTSQTRPNSAIRSGDWKLIRFHEDDRIELYDLKSDVAEQRNLSASNVGVATKLQMLLEETLEEIGARFPTTKAIQR